MSNQMITLLESFLKQDPNDGFTRFALAMEYKKFGDINKSEEVYRDLLEHDPNYVGAYYHLGKLYEETGQLDLAIQTYKTGIEIANSVNDFHASSELQQALMELD
jgi:Tfp pilus assembly protein PilF